MEEKATSLVGLVIVLIIVAIVLWFIFGNGSGLLNGRNLAAYDLAGCGCNRVSNCEVEKQEIIDSASTRYLIEQKNNESTQAISAQLRAQYDANQAEKLFDCKLAAIKAEILNSQALNAKDQEIQTLKLMANVDSKYTALSNQVEHFSCQTPKRPPFYACGNYCQNSCCNS